MIGGDDACKALCWRVVTVYWNRTVCLIDWYLRLMAGQYDSLVEVMRL